MKKSLSSSSQSSSLNASQVQLHKGYLQINTSKTGFMTPKKNEKERIFVQTPQAIYIPISQKYEQNFAQFSKRQEPLTEQRKPKKISIFDQRQKNSTRQKREVSTTSTLSLENRQNSSQIIKSKTSISFQKQRISEFFYYQNLIICKGLRKVIIYNFFNKSITFIPIKFDEFVMTPFPPYVFNCITGQYLNLYSEDIIQKYAQIQRKREQGIRNKTSQTRNHKRYEQQEIFNLDRENQSTSSIEIVIIKISKLQVECICKYGQTFYMGGYNRSVLPGGKKSQRRQIYLMEHLDPKINNKPKQLIKIQSSSFPVSLIQVQMPYLIIYCRPNFYIFALKSHQLLLTFQKQLKSCLLLEGRYAMNVINGIGISSRTSKQNIFTYDIQNTPIFGVEITEHKQETACICLQKTGRIFGCHKSALFEYIPTKRITRCVKLYSQSETIIWIESTPNNNLLVLRQTQNLEYAIEAFSVDQNSIGDY